MVRFFKGIELGGRRVALRALDTLFARRKKSNKIDLTPQRILFLRHDKIGDTIVTTPTLRALRERFPDAEITVVASPVNAEIMRRLPYVNSVVVYDKRVVSIPAFLRHLREGFDVVIDPIINQSLTTELVFALTKASHKVALDKGGGVAFADIVVPYDLAESDHIAWHTAIILRAFGIEPFKINLSFDFPLTDDERNWAASVTVPYRAVGVNISAGKISHIWQAEKHITLGRLLVEHGFVPFYLSSPDDRETLTEIVATVKGAVISPETPSVFHLGALLLRLPFIITPDTGIVHIASALGVSQVVLFPNRKRVYGMWGPRDVAHRSVLSHNKDTIHDIKPDAVASAVNELWDEIQ